MYDREKRYFEPTRACPVEKSAIYDSLILKPEPANEYDSNAVGVYTRNGKHIGYVPNFYSKAIFSLIENGAVPSITVAYINEKSTPHWWLKVNFKCEIPLYEGIETDELSPVMQ